MRKIANVKPGKVGRRKNQNVAGLYSLLFCFSAALAIYQTTGTIPAMGQTTIDKEVLSKLIIYRFLNNLDPAKDEMLLLRRNLPSELIIAEINKTSSTKVKLVDESVAGQFTHSFTSFNVRSRVGKVTFARNWRSPSGIGSEKTSYDYLCKKNRAVWRCNLTRMAHSEP